jgi:hypothetical protein
MTPQARSRLLVVVFALGAVLLWTATGLTAIPAGINDGPSRACLDAWDHRVVFDGESVVPESVAVDGAWQLLPLGVACSYIAPNGESVHIEPSIVPSVIGLHALAFTGVLVASRVSVRRAERPARDVTGLT